MNKEILESISYQAIELGDFDFSEEKIDKRWLGYEAATEEDIICLEKRLGIKLPSDYLEFLGITNGFASPCATEPTFASIQDVDFLKNIDPELIDIWRETGNEETAEILKSSICVGGMDEEQYFLLIPPSDTNGAWQYWKFAHWIPGEEIYDDLVSYFEYIESFIIESNME